MSSGVNPARCALGRDALSRHPANVEVPAYDPARLTPAVVHLGAGAFHRAHQAVYFDELAARGCTAWGVLGVGISRPDVAAALERQDQLYLLMERSGEARNTAPVGGSDCDYLVLAADPDAVTRRLADPRTRLVTMTITADGYRVTGGESSRISIFEPLVDALDERRRAGLPPFTVLSCDNTPDSGAAARAATIAVARRRRPEAVAWIEERACFPESMVDRITPATTDEDRDEVVDEFDMVDGSPVMTEPFSQWVIEDCFSDGRPPLDLVGARFVADVAPYKLVKSRLLNGAHCALGYVGRLVGHLRTDEAMADPLVFEFVSRLMRDEIAPLLPPNVDGMELGAYRTSLLKRFGNPAIADPLSRLCRRGSTKLPDYLLPSLHEARRTRPHELLTVVVAAWCRYLQGTDLAGQPIEVEDERRERLQPLALRSADDASLLLSVSAVFGDLGRDRLLCAEVTRLVRLFDQEGIAAVLGAAPSGLAA